MYTLPIELPAAILWPSGLQSGANESERAISDSAAGLYVFFEGGPCEGPFDVRGDEPALEDLGFSPLAVPETKGADLALPWLNNGRVCSNGIDEDQDGLTDCADDGCAGAPGCPADPPGGGCKKNCFHEE